MITCHGSGSGSVVLRLEDGLSCRTFSEALCIFFFLENTASVLSLLLCHIAPNHEIQKPFLNFGSLKQIQTDSNGHSYWSLLHSLTDSVMRWHIGLKANTKGSFPLSQSFSILHYVNVLHSALTVITGHH